MPQIHPCARTTPAVRADIARSKEPTGVLARRFGVSPFAARVVFLVTLLLPGPQFIAYLALWIVMPNER